MKINYTIKEACEELECGTITLMKSVAHLGIRIFRNQGINSKRRMTSEDVKRIDEFLSEKKFKKRPYKLP